MAQLKLFDDTNCLPLLSQTAQRVEQNPFIQKAEGKQESLPFTCQTCKDTGKVGEERCWCASRDSQLISDCRQISSGTLANLIGSKLYTVIEAVQADFVEFVRESNTPFEYWQAAWEAFWQTSRHNADGVK